MGENGKFINLLRSTRIERTFPSITLIIFACVLSGEINKEIYFLISCLILIYSSGGILNALKDKDYKLPTYSKIIVYILPIIAILLSLQHKILLIPIILWIILNFTYNLLSRKVLLLDTTLLAITHYLIPILSSFILLNIKIETTIIFSTVSFVLGWLILPIKNIKNWEKDRILQYKTLLTKYQNGKNLTINLAFLSIIPIIATYILFKMQIQFFFIPIFIIILTIIKKTAQLKNYSIMLNSFRLFTPLFTFSLIIFKTKNPIFLLSTFIPILFFLTLIIRKLIKN